MNDNLTPREQRSVEEATNDAKRKVEKFQKMRRIIKTIMKVVAIVGHSMPLIFGGIILAFIIAVSIFSVPLDLFGSGDLEEDMQAANTDNSKNDVSSEDWQCTAQELIDFINNYDSGNNDLKSGLISRFEEILQWQEDYGYSAALLITIAFEEGKTAEELDDFLNEMNEKAAKWKEEGYTTIQEIAEDYVGDETAQEWANNITKKMQETALKSGVIDSGEKAMTGDGYDSVYVSKSGKTYRNYKQNMGSYSTKQWCGTSTVKDDGCSLIAVTIILSGYQDRDIDPLVLAEQYAIKGAGMNIPGALSGNGIAYSQPLGADVIFSNEQKETIKAHVETGSPAIIKVVSPSPFTDSQHYMVLLDYNADTDEFYLSNPYTGNNSYGRTGWLDADQVLQYCNRFYAIK